MYYYYNYLALLFKKKKIKDKIFESGILNILFD